MQCVLHIIRKTYGYNKLEDAIALSQFTDATGMNKPAVCRALSGLKDKKIVIIKKDNKRITTYRINKKYRTWKSLSKRIMLSKEITTVIKKGNNRYQKGDIQKKKETITKERYSINSIEIQLSIYLYKLMLKNNPKVKKPNYQKWAEHIDKAMRVDKRTEEELTFIIKWSQDDDFWKSNILSTNKLRKHFDRMFVKSGKKTFESRPAEKKTKNDLIFEAFNILEKKGKSAFTAYCNSVNMTKEDRASVVSKWKGAYNINNVAKGILGEANGKQDNS